MRLPKSQYPGLRFEYEALIICQAFELTTDIEDEVKVTWVHTHRQNHALHTFLGDWGLEDIILILGRNLDWELHLFTKLTMVRLQIDDAYLVCRHSCHFWKALFNIRSCHPMQVTYQEFEISFLWAFLGSSWITSVDAIPPLISHFGFGRFTLAQTIGSLRIS